jgi:lysozyme
MIRMSPEGRKWLSILEGQRLKAYQDNKGVWTIGIGSTYWPKTGNPVKEGDELTSKEEMEAMFTEVLREYEEAVDKYLMKDDTFIRNGGPFGSNVTDALISFCFNIGITAFKRSTALMRFNKNYPLSSVSEAMSWFRKPDLETRREAEERCLLHNIYSDQKRRLTSGQGRV